MIVPAVMFIEMAIDSLKTVDQWVKEDQQKELSELGEVRLTKLGATGMTEDFRVGYELGLQTARMLLSTMPAAVINKVEI